MTIAPRGLYEDLLQTSNGDVVLAVRWLQQMGYSPPPAMAGAPPEEEEEQGPSPLSPMVGEHSTGSLSGDTPTAEQRAGAELRAPPALLCPISRQLMRDPVELPTGQTYDRPFIERWFALGGDTCPLTGQRVPRPPQLRPNLPRRRAAEDWAARRAPWLLDASGHLGPSLDQGSRLSDLRLTDSISPPGAGEDPPPTARAYAPSPLGLPSRVARDAAVLDSRHGSVPKPPTAPDARLVSLARGGAGSVLALDGPHRAPAAASPFANLGGPQASGLVSADSAALQAAALARCLTPAQSQVGVVPPVVASEEEADVSGLGRPPPSPPPPSSQRWAVAGLILAASAALSALLIVSFWQNGWVMAGVLINPFLGPGVQGALGAGAQVRASLTGLGQWWRLVTMPWVPPGVLSAGPCIILFVSLGRHCGQHYPMPALVLPAVVVPAGVLGAMLSALLNDRFVVAGGVSGPAALLGMLVAEQVARRRHYANGWLTAALLVLVAAVLGLLSVAPMQDFWSVAGAWTGGFRLGGAVVFAPRPGRDLARPPKEDGALPGAPGGARRRTWLPWRRPPPPPIWDDPGAGAGRRRSPLARLGAARAACLAAFVALASLAVAGLAAGYDAGAACGRGCSYLSCAPASFWICMPVDAVSSQCSLALDRPGVYGTGEIRCPGDTLYTLNLAPLADGIRGVGDLCLLTEVLCQRCPSLGGLDADQGGTAAPARMALQGETGASDEMLPAGEALARRAALLDWAPSDGRGRRVEAFAPRASRDEL